MKLKERVENNPVIWTLSMLLAGFLAGIGAYTSVLSIAQLQVVRLDEPSTVAEYKSKLAGLQSKERFLSLYLRYFLSRYEGDESARENAEQSLLHIVRFRPEMVSPCNRRAFL